MNQIVGVKELRENLPAYVDAVQDGKSFTVVKRSKPIFKIIPIDEDDDGQWERVVDFTKINKDGVDAREVLNHL
jgi:prevent-host-death family protein